MRMKQITVHVKDQAAALLDPKTAEDRLNNEIAVLSGEIEELDEAMRTLMSQGMAKREELQRLLRIRGS